MYIFQNFKIRANLVAIVAAAGLSTVFSTSSRAQEAVVIPEAALTAALSQCTTSEACDAALQALIAELAAANPGVDLSLIIGSVVSTIAAGYNAGTVPAAAAQVALTSAGSIASSNGLTTLAAAATAAAETVAAGDTIDLEAVAEASGSPT